MKLSIRRIIALLFWDGIAERRQWKRHCVEMQNALNEEHHKRFGWYVNDQHELIVTR